MDQDPRDTAGHIAVACGLVYVLSIASGLATLFPGIVHDYLTAGLLVAYGASFLYLAWAVQEIVWMNSAPGAGALGRRDSR